MFPLHTWLPDAHSEAPSMVSALLSGALLNCAFLGIVRVMQVCAAAGHLAFGRDLLVSFGLLSMAVAAVFLVGQTDYKRLLAYSSVEHMGLAMVGFGAIAVRGAIVLADRGFPSLAFNFPEVVGIAVVVGALTLATWFGLSAAASRDLART